MTAVHETPRELEVQLSLSGTIPTRPPIAFAQLPALRFLNVNSGATCETRLFDPHGAVDAHAALELDRTLADARDPAHLRVATLDRRALRILFRAAYHFGAGEVTVVSAYRKPGRYGQGLHASARAIDFSLGGVSADELATYLRTVPRVGVGVYTHPRTQYVHLDVRDRSYHWVDASGPRRHGGEWPLSRFGVEERDASYTPADDLPEGAYAAEGP
jgi:uncharacterized protein YcbK (DUF882 family)